MKLREAEAVAEAVEALPKLHSREMRQKLRRYVNAQVDDNSLVIRHGDTFVNNRDPLFWCHCFVRLFPMGGLRRKVRGTRQLVAY